MPIWTNIANPTEAFSPLSNTGQLQLTGGYGLGTYGGGGYGIGDDTIAVNSELKTAWTPYTLK